MNELEVIKREILERDLIAPLLESMGCQISNTSNCNRIEAALPNGDNRRSVQVYTNEFLTSRIRSRAHVPVRDICDIVSYIKFNAETMADLNSALPKSRRYIVKTLGLEDCRVNNNTENDPNGWLRDIKKKRKQQFRLSDIAPNPTLPESVMNGFVNLPHIEWIDDGITYQTQQEFEVCFDIYTERICFPIRDRNGRIVGVKGRATRRSEVSNFKYMPIYSFQKSKELFNLHRAMPHIQEKNEVILVEAEKSCMKLWQMGYKHCVSQMGSDISRIQAEIVKRLAKGVKIILAYDKDKSPKEVKRFATVFKDCNNVYGIVDTEDLLEGSDSPCDKGLDTWEKLYANNCYKIFNNP